MKQDPRTMASVDAFRAFYARFVVAASGTNDARLTGCFG
jgi:hypothetical protein